LLVEGGLASSGLTIQPLAAIGSSTNNGFQFLRSPNDSSPGATIFGVGYLGAIALGGTQAGNISNSLSSGAAWSNNGRTWSNQGSGQQMQIQGAAVQVLDNSGTLQFDFVVSETGLAFGSAVDAEISRVGAAELQIFNRNVGNSGGRLDVSQWGVLTIYSAAGTALPACAAGTNGVSAIVSDAVTPTFRGAYTSGGGGVMARVLCVSPTWITD
jgi:hypothetical protein